MRTGLLFAAATAVVLSLSWGGVARAAVGASSPPSHGGVLVVHFGRSLPEKELGEFLTTFMVDLNRVTARLPVFDVNAAIFQSCFTYETVVYVYYDVRGSEAAFPAMGRLCWKPQYVAGVRGWTSNARIAQDVRLDCHGLVMTLSEKH